MLARVYLRASAKDQDAERAKESLLAFASDHGLTVAATYTENESGAKLDRPELFRLLADALPGDLLLVEQVDRLSRLNADDWEKLKSLIAAKRVRIVAQDLPTSWRMATDSDETTSRFLEAVNGMLLDMLAAIARKDYTDRRRRQAQGIIKAKAQGLYRGRSEDEKRNATISAMLKSGMSWSSIVTNADCSRATIAKLSKRIKASATA